MPSFDVKKTPGYPEDERALGKEASVLAEATIDAAGAVVEVRILRSAGARFDDAVREALAASRFHPGYVGDRPVAVRLQVPYQFWLK